VVLVYAAPEGSMTTVINIKDLSAAEKKRLLAGKLPGYVYIGRYANCLGPWGNRFSHRCGRTDVTVVATREIAIERHAKDVSKDSTLRKRIVQELRGKTLVCFCKPLACHGDTLARIADQETAEDVLRRFVQHTKLMSGRWPCPNCGRAGPKAPLCVIHITFEKQRFSEGQWVGCWLCNLEPLIEAAERALA